MTPSTQLAAKLPPRTNTIVPDTKARETSRFIFFAGDVITSAEKYTNPTRDLGGVELEMYHTLKESGREIFARPDVYNVGGVLFRCAITELRTFLMPVNPNMVAPEQRDKYKPGYVKENGRYDAASDSFKDVTVTGQIYREIYPGDEIGFIVAPTSGLKPGGVVEITALAGMADDMKLSAQMHFFPEWEAIQRLEKPFPSKLKVLRNEIVKRTAEAAGNRALQSIGAEMIRSCDEFRLWGLRYLKAWRQIVKWADADVDSPIAGYNDLAEMLFESLEVNREDSLGQQRDESGAIDRLADILANRMMGAAAPAAAEAPAAQLPGPEGIADALNEAANSYKMGQQVTVVEDGAIGKVVWKGPGKIKVEFEDGTSKVVGLSDAFPMPEEETTEQ